MAIRRVDFHANRDWVDLLFRIAAERGLTLSSYIRRAITAQLRTDGIVTEIPPADPPGRKRQKRK